MMRDAEQIRYLVLAAQREGNRALAAAFAEISLTPSQAEVIRVLDQTGAISLKRLGELLVCESGTNPSRLVDRLVTSGHVSRTEGEHDRRQVVLELTTAGREASGSIAAIEEAMYAQIGHVLESVDVEPFIETLRALSAGTPAGRAVEARDQLA